MKNAILNTSAVFSTSAQAPVCPMPARDRSWGTALPASAYAPAIGMEAKHLDAARAAQRFPVHSRRLET